MTTSSESTMRDAHENWHRELGLWLSDIRAWEQENRRAMHDLSRIESLLVRHALDCETYARTVRSHQRSVESLDADLARKAGSDGEAELLPRHGEQEQVQEQRRELHREIRDTHRAVLEHLARLRAALGQALHRAV